MLFEKIRSALLSHHEPAAEDPPSASDYVDWLPRYMLSQSCMEMQIDSSRPLPGGDEAPSSPSPTAVLNRLKVLCGLNPFRFAEPQDGCFERRISGHTLKCAVRFEDGAQHSVGTLTLSVHA